MGNSAKVVIQQDMKGRRHKYGFNNNEREKAQKKRVVDDETVDKHQLDERGTSNNLKVVHSGTKEFKIASNKRDLFLGFSEHQERLRKKLALEEGRIFAANEQGLDDAPQPKSKAPARWIVVKCNRQNGTTECGYYVMHWMSTIILGSFRNNWEAYFNDPRPLEPERLKALRIQWAQFYLRVRDQA
ncbi:hypothetical protein GmHk_20G056927 [Glycine max]|nr:hypothetical protein GmHk_20G056927 [Glycine max]